MSYVIKTKDTENKEKETRYKKFALFDVKTGELILNYGGPNQIHAITNNDDTYSVQAMVKDVGADSKDIKKVMKTCKPVKLIEEELSIFVMGKLVAWFEDDLIRNNQPYQ